VKRILTADFPRKPAARADRYAGLNRDDPFANRLAPDAPSFAKGELKAQSIGDFLSPPLISDQIAGRRNDSRLPTVSVVPAYLDTQVSNAKRGNNHVGQLCSGSEFLGHEWIIP